MAKKNNEKTEHNFRIISGNKYNVKAAKYNIRKHFKVDADIQDGKSLEKQLREATAKGEAIETPLKNLIYTEKKDGIKPEYDHRSDRFEMALEAAEIANYESIRTSGWGITEEEKEGKYFKAINAKFDDKEANEVIEDLNENQNSEKDS